MIRLTCAAMAGLMWWLPPAVAETAATTAGPAPAAAIEELVLANRILNDRGVWTPMATSVSAIRPIQIAI